MEVIAIVAIIALFVTVIISIWVNNKIVKIIGTIVFCAVVGFLMIESISVGIRNHYLFNDLKNSQAGIKTLMGAIKVYSGDKLKIESIIDKYSETEAFTPLNTNYNEIIR